MGCLMLGIFRESWGEVCPSTVFSGCQAQCLEFSLGRLSLCQMDLVLPQFFSVGFPSNHDHLGETSICGRKIWGAKFDHQLGHQLETIFFFGRQSGGSLFQKISICCCSCSIDFVLSFLFCWHSQTRLQPVAHPRVLLEGQRIFALRRSSWRSPSDDQSALASASPQHGPEAPNRKSFK